MESQRTTCARLNSGMTLEDRSQDEVRQVAEGLKRKIRDAGLTYKEVEERAGMGRDYLRQVLRGSVKLRFEHVLRLLHVLGVPPADFFAEVFVPASAAPLPAKPTGPTFDQIIVTLQRSFTDLQRALNEMLTKEAIRSLQAEDLGNKREDRPPGRRGSKAS
jgi:transcriptional regulator with XRE-family HTH domain